MFISLNEIKKITGLTIDASWVSEHLTQLGLEVESVSLWKAPSGIKKLIITEKTQPDAGGVIDYTVSCEGSSAVLRTTLSLDIEACYAAVEKKSGHLEVLTPHSLGWNHLQVPIKAVAHECFDTTWSLDDQIIELSLTPNRGDCLSYLGVISEIFIAARKPFSRTQLIESYQKKFPVRFFEAASSTRLSVGPEVASSYHLGQVDLSSCQTPLWLEVFLIKQGLTPKSFPVALTNYMMMFFGQPMHVFDKKRVQAPEEFIVELGDLREPVELLDGTTLKEAYSVPLIKDGQKNVLALAGLMGLSSSAVDEQSTTVLFESAHFDLEQIRLSRKTGLVTDSSLRFERGVCPKLSAQVLEIALGIVQAYDSKAKVYPIASYDFGLSEKEPRVLSVETEKLESLLGKAIFPDELSLVMELLGGSVEGKTLRLPSFSHRYDLELSCDLIEEVMRVHNTLYPEKTLKADMNNRYERSYDWLLDFFIHQGFFEVISFGFTQRDKAQAFTSSSDLIELANPISEELAVMNPSLLPQLADIASKASAHRFHTIRVVESAWVFDKTYPQYQKEVISGLLLEESHEPTWHSTQRPLNPFYQIKALLAALSSNLHERLTIKAHDYSFYEDGHSWQIFFDKTQVGHFGVLAIELCQKFSWPTQLWCFEIDNEQLKENKIQYQALSRYPKVSRDLSFYWNEPRSVDFLLQFIQNKEAGDGNLISSSLFDYFEEELTSKISVGLRLVFQSKVKTLTDKEVDSELEELMSELMDKFSIQQRQSSQN